ncbi:UvrD-helicase domain-containing protein [Buchnera aphidicola (Formosaphis micheliae)]|uniref:UvrD-helicase domain-containing protein n=1 Tax=Buchnera aphidicola TaxID=9 RepID=UPI0031CCD4C6
MNLNYHQKKAVHFVNGPCLVLAGAGSGKTKVIINKIIYLINICGYKTKNIVSLTFNNKSAIEIKNRIKKQILTEEINKLTISTFHSLGLKIIKSEHKALGIPLNFSILDEKDQLILIKDLSINYVKNDKKLFKKLLLFISYCKNKLLYPNEINKQITTNIQIQFIQCYKRYYSYLKSCHILDFDDLILLPTVLLKNNNLIKSNWQKKIRYLLVDEYQDINTLQYKLIKLLSGTNANFTLVGDDNQSIYSWRGAKINNILNLKKDYPTLKIIKMEHNYRSSKRILKVANFLISHNTNLCKKELFSELENGSKIKILVMDNEEEEAKQIIQQIISHRYLHNTVYKDYVILYRNNYQSKIFEKFLIQNQLPYSISSNVTFLNRPEIKYLIIYLRFITNLNDNYAFTKIINIPSRKIGNITVKKLTALAKKNKISLFQSIFNPEINNILNKNSINILQNFAQWIKEIVQIVKFKPTTVLNKIVCDIQYKEWLLNQSSDIELNKTKIKNIDLFISWINQMLKNQDTKNQTNLSNVIAQFTLRDVIENDNSDIYNNNIHNKIHLMTLHSSKGLEFPFVFMTGMEEGILPHYSVLNCNVDEERRLMYVGITRAKKELFFSYCKKRYQFGTSVYPQPSRFLLELPQNEVSWIQINNINFYKNISKKYFI